MKRIPVLCAYLSGVAFLLWAGSGCRTASETALPQVSTVIGLNGDARYRDDSNTLHTVKLSDKIPQGSTIQIASGMGNKLTLAIGKKVIVATRDNPRPYRNIDKLILFENSSLKLNKVTSRTLGKYKIPDVRLSLEAGSAIFYLSMNGPSAARRHPAVAPDAKVETDTPALDKPYFEIRGSNTVLRVDQAFVLFSANGITRVVSGTVALERTDQGITKNLSGWEQYDPVTGEISEMDEPIRAPFRPGEYPVLLPKPSPGFGVPPRRPF